jgi:hypothetical protein
VVVTLPERGVHVYALNSKQMDRFRDRHTVASPPTIPTMLAGSFPASPPPCPPERRLIRQILSSPTVGVPPSVFDVRRVRVTRSIRPLRRSRRRSWAQHIM